MNVTLDWMGCATFRLTLGDLVIFLDAYIDRVPSAVPIGITRSFRQARREDTTQQGKLF